MSKNSRILWFEDQPDETEIPDLTMKLRESFKLCRNRFESATHTISSGIHYLLEAAFGETKENYVFPDVVLLDSKLNRDGLRDDFKLRINELCKSREPLKQDVDKCFEEHNGGAVLRLLADHFLRSHPNLKVVYVSRYGEESIKDDHGGKVLQKYPGSLSGYFWKGQEPGLLINMLFEILQDERRGFAVDQIRERLHSDDADYLLGPKKEDYQWSDAYRLALNDLVQAGEDTAWEFNDQRTTHPKPYFSSTEAGFEDVLKSHKELPRALILGEKGCGKERFSRALHRMWYSAEDAPFVTINIGGVPPWSAGAALQLRLFGGNLQPRQPIGYGCVPRAWNGTLLMDEIGDANKDVQDTLLRLIQEGEYEPILASDWEVWAAHCCFIGATNQEVYNPQVVRQDVVDRLAIHVIKIPPLRETREDIPIWMRKIAKHLAEEHNARHQTRVPSEFEFLEAAANIAQNYTWPGNLREMTHAIRRMQIRAASEPRIPLSVVGSEISRLEGNRTTVARLTPKVLPVDEEQRRDFIQNVAGRLRLTGKKLARADVVKVASEWQGKKISEHLTKKHFEDMFGEGDFDKLRDEIASAAGVTRWGDTGTSADDDDRHAADEATAND